MPDLAKRATFFERLPARRNADALLVSCFDLDKEETARLDDLGMPVIYISQHVEGRPSVYVDDVAAACKATRHLIYLRCHECSRRYVRRSQPGRQVRGAG
ncbi:type 1 periplasmic-binding domain-containing protein [Streptomyces albicerus]|uniref:hypothetical protein n=1 Tax=Streptomyces albicerus TaxID=2569859 RepID=UPI001CEDEA75|nr:hypothetical protein [Streptomyces albicerus]